MAETQISEITLPEHYIRGDVKASNVKDLLDVVANHNGVKEWTELIGKKVKWPFPEIDIAKTLTLKPEKVKAKKGERTPAIKLKRWYPYEIIDGATRWTVAKKLRLKTIDAITRGIDDPAKRFMHQFTTNFAHGLRLDKDQRDNAIRIMGKVYEMSLKDIQKETGLDLSSISRIINSKQRKEGERKKTEKKKDLTETDDRPATMTVDGWLSRLQFLIAEFPKLANDITSFVVNNLPKGNRKQAKLFADRLLAIAAIFDLVEQEHDVEKKTAEAG